MSATLTAVTVQTAELLVLVSCFVLGCRRAVVACKFLPMVVVFLGLFWLLVGNPVGLLASVGGWIILVLALASAAMLANGFPMAGSVMAFVAGWMFVHVLLGLALAMLYVLVMWRYSHRDHVTRPTSPA